MQFAKHVARSADVSFWTLHRWQNLLPIRHPKLGVSTRTFRPSCRDSSGLRSLEI